MIKKYDNVNTDKLISALNDIFELSCEEFNNKYGTGIMEIDYEDIEDFAVVRNSKTDNRLDYAELELNNFTQQYFLRTELKKFITVKVIRSQEGER